MELLSFSMEDPKNIYLILDPVTNGRLIAGTAVDGIPLVEENIHRISLNGEEFDKDRSWVDLIEHTSNLIHGGRTVFIYGEGKRSYIFCMCFLRRWCNKTPKESWEMLRELYERKVGGALEFSLSEWNQMKRYKPPKTIVLMVERESNREYDRIIPFEITKLPPYSRIIYIANGGRMDAKISDLLSNVIDCYLIKLDSLHTIFQEKYRINQVFLCFYEIKFSPREVKEFINGNMHDYTFYLFDTKTKEKIKERVTYF